jgi:hypothetical protein
MVSKLFGKLEAKRHLMDGASAAIAGIAIVAPAARPTLAFFRNERLCMNCLLWFGFGTTRQL